MAKVFSIALFVAVLASHSVFATESTDVAELKKNETEIVTTTQDVVVEEVQ